MASAGLQFKAVGASLDTLAKRCKELPKGSVQAFAYANAGVLQVAGKIVVDKYTTPGEHAYPRKSGSLQYTTPPGGTHGPVQYNSFQTNGKKKKTLVIARERNLLFIKGKFVSRSGDLRDFAERVSRSTPAETTPNVIAEEVNKNGALSCYVDRDGKGILTISGGYRGAEMGQKGTISNGVRGFWRGLRTASSRWGTLIKKRYPELLALGAR